MTIAIGMLYDKGVLVCADSLVTTGTLGSFQSKILGYRVDGLDVVFALAGNVDLAESVIEQLRGAVLNHAGKKRTAQQVADSLRPIMAKEYHEQVITAGFLNSVYDYQLVVAIRPDGEKARIYYAYQKTLKSARDGCRCIGAGSDLAQYLLAWVNHEKLPADKLADVAGYIVGAIKLHMPGVVGGNNLIMKLSDDGEIVFYRRSDLQAIEQWAPAYEIESRQLLWSFLDTQVSEEQFSGHLDRFGRIVQYYRNQYKSKVEHTWSVPPMEADGAIIDLRTTAQQVPQPTKHDR